MTKDETSEWESGPWAAEYILIDSLGGGGQGNTFHAKTKSAQIDVAVKILQSDRDNSKARRRMAREVAALEALAQTDAVVPNYIKSNIREALQDKKIRPYVVMEYVEGRTLNRAIESDDPMALADAIEFVQTLSETVVIAHSEDTVHRDIKPQNIVLKGEDYSAPYLIDFGLSFNETDVSNDDLTNIRESIGNRFLTLPETQLAGSDDKRNYASDVTLLSGILLYILTGEYPGYVSKDLDKQPHRLHQDLLKDTAGESLVFLNQFFDRAFQFDVEDRFEDVNEFQDRLKKLSDQSNGEIPAVNPADTAAEIRRDLFNNSRPYQLKNLISKHEGCLNKFMHYLKSRSKDKALSPTVMNFKMAHLKSNGEIEVLLAPFSLIGFPEVTLRIPNYVAGFGVCRYFIFARGGNEVSVGFQSAISKQGASIPNVREAISVAPFHEIYNFYDWNRDADDFIKAHFDNWFDQTLRQIYSADVAH